MPLVALQFLGVRQTNSEAVPLTFLPPFAFFFGWNSREAKWRHFHLHWAFTIMGYHHPVDGDMIMTLIELIKLIACSAQAFARWGLWQFQRFNASAKSVSPLTKSCSHVVWIAHATRKYRADIPLSRFSDSASHVVMALGDNHQEIIQNQTFLIWVSRTTVQERRLFLTKKEHPKRMFRMFWILLIPTLICLKIGSPVMPFGLAKVVWLGHSLQVSGALRSQWQVLRVSWESKYWNTAKNSHTNVQTQMDPLCIVTLRPGKQLETDRTPRSTINHDWDLIGKKTNSGKHSFWFSHSTWKNHPCSWPQQCILFWCFWAGCQALTAPPLACHHCKGHFDQTVSCAIWARGLWKVPILQVQPYWFHKLTRYQDDASLLKALQYCYQSFHPRANCEAPPPLWWSCQRRVSPQSQLLDGKNANQHLPQQWHPLLVLRWVSTCLRQVGHWGPW